MKFFYGKSLHAPTRTVIGRITFGEKEGSVLCRGEIARIFVGRKLPDFIDEGFVGGVFPFSLSESFVKTESKLPSLFISDDDLIELCRYDGRIAFLDTLRSSLIVCPDLKTLDLYGKRELSVGPSLLSCSSPAFSSVSDGKLIDIGRDISFLDSVSEESIFELLYSKAERSPDAEICVRVDLSCGGADRQIFITSLRALYRAAVYGRFSLMFDGIEFFSGIDEILSLVGEILGELEIDGREIDSFIPKGVVCSSPVLLLSLGVTALGNGSGVKRISGIDFLTLDVDLLTDKFFSGDLWERLFSKSSESVDAAIRILTFILDVGEAFGHLKLIIRKRRTADIINSLLTLVAESDGELSGRFFSLVDEVFTLPELKARLFSIFSERYVFTKNQP